MPNPIQSNEHPAPERPMGTPEAPATRPVLLRQGAFHPILNMMRAELNNALAHVRAHHSEDPSVHVVPEINQDLLEPFEADDVPNTDHVVPDNPRPGSRR